MSNNNESPSMFFVRHGHSCSNLVKEQKTKKNLLSNLTDYNTNTDRTRKQKLTQTILKKSGLGHHALIKNPDLSGLGKKQASDLANHISTIYNSNTLPIVFCSPLARAMETAYYAFKIPNNLQTQTQSAVSQLHTDVSPSQLHTADLRSQPAVSKLINSTSQYSDSQSQLPQQNEQNHVTHKFRKFNYKFYNMTGDTALDKLSTEYIYIIPFIKEEGDTPDNKLPSIAENKNKIFNFIKKNNENITMADIFETSNNNNNNMIPSTINLKDLIHKLESGDRDIYFVSHSNFIKKFLKMKTIINNTAIINIENKNIISRQIIDSINNNDIKLCLKSKNVCNDTKLSNIIINSYNCNNMPLDRLKKYILDIIITHNNTKTMENIYVFGIQESFTFNYQYKNMLNTIIETLNNSITETLSNSTESTTEKKMYTYYYFDKLTMSSTKLFIIYKKDFCITFDNPKYYNLKNISQKFNKHILQVDVKYNDDILCRLVTLHLNKEQSQLEDLFKNKLKAILRDELINEPYHAILFGDFNTSLSDDKLKQSGKFKNIANTKIDEILATLGNKNSRINNYNTIPNNANNMINKISNITKSNYKNSKIKISTPTYYYNSKTGDLKLTKKKLLSGNEKKIPSYPDKIILYNNIKNGYDIKYKIREDSSYTIKTQTGSDHKPILSIFSITKNNLYESTA